VDRDADAVRVQVVLAGRSLGAWIVDLGGC